MQLRRFFAGDVSHLPAAYSQRVSDEGAMAAPGNSLGTHNRDRGLFGQRFELLQTYPELLRRHVVREATKRGVLPASIDGILACVPQATERSEMPIANTRLPQRVRQRVRRELRVVPGFRHGTHIDQFLNGMRCEQSDELIDGAC